MNEEVGGTMAGLWLSQGRLEYRDDLAVPIAQPGEALIEVHLAGVCGTDLQLVQGYGGFEGIPGHEFVGEIASCPGAPERIGQRVAGEINIGCDNCPYCAQGLHNHCPQRRVVGIRGYPGAFANFVKLPLESLHPVPPEISDRQAVFAEPLAAALRVRHQIDTGAVRHALLIGAGRLGLLIAEVLRETVAGLEIVARSPARAALLKARGLVALAPEAVQPRRYDLVVEATGTPQGFEDALKAVRPLGTIVLKSTCAAGSTIDLAPIVISEVNIVGSRCGSMAEALRFLQHRNPTSGLIDQVLPLSRGVDAIRRAGRPGVLKILLDCTVATSLHH